MIYKRRKILQRQFRERLKEKVFIQRPKNQHTQSPKNQQSRKLQNSSTSKSIRIDRHVNNAAVDKFMNYNIPKTAKEMRKIFNGAEEVIIPRFITKFAKGHYEVGGLIKAYQVDVKGKKVVVIVPRQDPSLMKPVAPDSINVSDYNRLIAKPDNERVKITKGGMIGSFHTHPLDKSERLSKGFRFSDTDLLNSIANLSASLVVEPKEARLFLPIDVRKNTKLKTTGQKYDIFSFHYEGLQTIPVAIKSDKEVWDLLRRVKKKR